MRYVLLAIRIDVKQSGFGLSVLGFRVGVPDLGMMKINPEKGETWFFQAVRKIRLQLRTPKLLYHLFIFDQSSKTGYGSVLPLFGTGKSYVDDAIAIASAISGFDSLTRNQRLSKSQSAQSIGRLRSSPFACTVVSIPTWTDLMISPIFLLSLDFDVISG
jgi:hypothetical protein